MRGINKVVIIGTLGADPETRQFNNGGMVANISVATSEQWTDKQSGEKRESTEWHRIVINGRLAGIAAQYLRKGSKVYIEGSLRTRKYQAQDGTDRYVTEIRAMQMQMLDGPPAGSSQNYGSNNQNFSASNAGNPKMDNQEMRSTENSGRRAAPSTPGPVDDDIPFAPHFGG